MNKKIIKKNNEHFVLLACLLVLCILGLAGCSKEKPDGKSHPKTVTATRVKKVVTHRVISVSGSIHPETTVNLGFLVAGKVQGVAAEVGEFVEKGRVMARLDPTDYQNGLQIAEAKYTEVKSEYDRLTRLHKKGSLTPHDYGKIVAGRAEAEANYRIYKKKVADTLLTSPVSGFVSKRRVEKGEIVNQGDPCFTVINTSTVEARMAVPESEIALIKEGQTARVTVPALGSSHFEGTVTQIDPVADPLTRTFNVKVIVSNPEHTIRAGMIALSNIDIEKKATRLTIPGAAVLRSPDNLLHVFVVDPETGTVFQRRITLAAFSGPDVEVKTGLTPDDLVVTAGQETLTEGMTVTTHVESRRL